MARTPTAPLDGGAPFPAMTLRTVGGGTVTLPDPQAAGFTVLLVYRGHW